MIIYEGLSELDQSPIVVIATSGSKNRKTGNMLQIWILSQELDPIETNRTGQDRGICGDCPLKGEASHKDKGTALKRSCYVLLQNAPLSIWKKYKRGGYEKARSLTKLGAGQAIRLGAYGDPAAIPTRILKQLLKNAYTWTGYTHQLSIISDEARELMLDHVMASVETLDQAKAIWKENGRTFRVLSDKNQLHQNEIFCPATPEGGSRTDCKKCGLCKGRAITAKSIAVLAHGAGTKHALTVIN